MDTSKAMARRETQQELGYQPTALTLEDMKLAVEREPDPGVQAALVTAWLTAARGGCTLQLRKESIELQPDQRMTVQFRKGKSVIARGLQTTLPEWATPTLASWVTAAHRGLLFPQVTGEQLKLALRRVHPAYEQRSIRRGSLQAMSAAGCPSPVLRTHKPTNIAEVPQLGIPFRRRGTQDAAACTQRTVDPYPGDNTVPRYWSMLGVDAPGWTDVVEHSPIETKTWPLHVKKVRLIDIEKVKQLPCTQPGTQPFFEKVSRWLTNGDLSPPSCWGDRNCRTHSQPWENSEIPPSSVAAEPEGVWRAVCRFVRPSDRSVAVLTDHQSLVAPAAKGYGKGWYYNLLLLRLRTTWPRITFRVSHVAGTHNPADEASRGGIWSQTQEEHARTLAGERGVALGADEREGEALTSVSAHKKRFIQVLTDCFLASHTYVCPSSSPLRYCVM
jgi:hypothetical protein